MTKAIIGLAGMGGTGKTTLADIMCKDHRFVRRSFAAPLRAMLAAIGVPEADTRDPVRKLEPHAALGGRSPVHAMETLGTAWGRNMIDSNMWVDAALRMLHDDRVVFDDVRYQNEVDGILNAGGHVFRLVDPDMEPARSSDHAVLALERVVDLPARAAARNVENLIVWWAW